MAPVSLGVVRHFIIRTNHNSLKELLTQVIQTSEQQHYLIKFMGYKFSIEYKAGAENSAADALSRRHELHCMQCRPAFSSAQYNFLEESRQENASCTDLNTLQHQLKNGTSSDSAFTWRDGILYHKNKIFLSKESKLKDTMLREFHATPTDGHVGAKRTFIRLSANFYWEGMRKEVKDFVDRCVTCQTIKYSTTAPNGLLHPLEIPSRVWEDLALDFIVGLPNSKGYSTILTKYAHFGALPANYTVTKVAKLFREMIIKFHELPPTICLIGTPFLLANLGRNYLR